MKRYAMYAGQQKIFIGTISILGKVEEASQKNMGVGCIYALFIMTCQMKAFIIILTRALIWNLSRSAKSVGSGNLAAGRISSRTLIEVTSNIYHDYLLRSLD